MESVFHDLRHDDGQFGHLMPPGGRVVPRQGLAATAAGSGQARDDLANLAGCNQRALLAGMARLTAAFLLGLARGGRRATFAVKAVRGWGQRRVGGVGPQLVVGPPTARIGL